MSDNPFRFYFPFRVRYAETDAQGIVFNGNYLTYFDTAIYEYFRELGFDFAKNYQTASADFHTVHIRTDFLAPAHFDDMIHAGIRTGKIGRSSLTFEIVIASENKDHILVKGTVIWVYVDQESKKSVPLPQDLVNRIKRFENKTYASNRPSLPE
ncbi:MAG: acyl-CoA thioesterase [Desulfobacterales bacterium]|nr:acyl-CoA thioesterase [Desulfobacterales bacterium]